MVIRFHARRWSEEDLARRICQLMDGKGEVWLDETGGSRRWHIGVGNNCWLHSEGDETYRLNYRYHDKRHMDALAVVLEWRLGVGLLPDGR